MPLNKYFDDILTCLFGGVIGDVYSYVVELHIKTDKIVIW